MSGPFYEPGTYHGKITEIGLTENSKSKPMIVVKAQILAAIIPGNVERTSDVSAQYERTIYLNIPEDDEYKKYVVMKLRHAGWNGSRFEDLESLVGNSCRLECKHEVSKSDDPKYSGTVQERWDLSLPPKQGKPIEHKPQLAKTLNALFGKTLKEIPAESPSPSKQEPVAAGNVPDDSEDSRDIPF